MVEQGDLIYDAGLKAALLVVSNQEYNKSGFAIVCPITKNDGNDLAFPVKMNAVQGFVQCDDLRKVHYEKRDYVRRGRVHVGELTTILGRIASVMDWI